MKRYNVQPEAWAPLGGGRHKPFEYELLKGIVEAHGKTLQSSMCGFFGSIWC
ncbi:hypothetical protein [uncultured Vibrio sp.]|uniref:hypothetical protein n=1 Tax=uncultured Vibrio sp. TaxID=114054 RepID=UPI0029C6E649|nr:hypothetical protein [uncultured Vibrio sp.]